ncbi:MAG: hypothetical protein AMXMBFR58_32860 [Phycisphaerae bacterium]|nr:hypothetical protein [Phycisphaerales bacterium]
MPRPSDLFKNTGTGGPSPASKKTLNLNNPVTGPEGKPNDPDHITAQKPDKGHTLHAPQRAQGGAGASGARPKV